MPTSTTLYIEFRDGTPTMTATFVTNLSFGGGEVMFHGTIEGVTQDWAFQLSTVKRIRRHVG